MSIDEPILTIGREGDARYEFSRIAGVQGLSDGRIVVADGDSKQLRFFSPEGEHQTTVGGDGEGPGEFRSIVALQRLPGDTLVAADVSLARTSVFSREPRLVETTVFGPAMPASPPDAMTVCGTPHYVGVGRDRVHAMWSWPCTRAEGEEGVRQYMARLLLWSPMSGETTSVGPLPRTSAYERPDLEIRWRFAFMRFGEIAVAAAGGDGFVVTTPGRFGFTALDDDGVATLIVRDAFSRRSVDATIATAIRADRRERSRDIPLPDSMPAVDEIVMGARQIWTRHRPLSADGAKHWSVYSDAGRQRSMVALPYRFDLTAVLAGRAYGVSTDDLGIERVEVFDVSAVPGR